MKITFTDKTSIDNRPDLSDVEKITGRNINEIKNVVNANADKLESTKVKTENLSTEVEALKQKDTAQDTNIQKNAKDIEANQNNIKALQVENAEVKAENERLRSDIESISLLGEANGESIDLNDSSNARFNKFEIAGNHKQEATPSLEFPSEIKTVKDNVNVTVANKNYINIENTSKTINGITFTVNSDGSILANGTATDRATYPIQNNFKKFEAGQYFVSGCPSGGSVSTYYLILWNENWVSMGSEYGKGKLVSLSNQKVKLHINIMKGTVCNNLLFKPQMEKGTKATDYEAHQEQAITMPVQQEMLEGDYFDWKNEKQTNLFEKIVLNGVDKKCTASKAVGDGSEFQWAFTVAQSLPYVRTVYSNVAKLSSDFGKVNGIRITANSTIAYVRSKIEVLNGKEATVENVNELLKTMYDNGNPATFYIEKASNRELDFTEEQKAVAKQIKETAHSYKGTTHIFSTDEISPIFDVVYAKDLNTVINNMQAQIINNASGEV